MKRRGVILLALVVITVLIGLAIAFDPAARVQGWVRGEPFYKGRSATAWNRDLRLPDSPQSGQAFSALVAGKAEAVPVCVWVLRTAAEPEARWRAADALGKIGKDGATAAPDLIHALKDPDPLVRGVAIRSIGELAPDVPGGVTELIALLPDNDAIQVLSRFGAVAAPAVPRLMESLKHPDATTRWQSARTLGKIGLPSLPATNELARLLENDGDPLVREHAAESLGEIGPQAAQAIPILTKALKDEVARVRRDAVRSLGQMGAVAKSALPEVRLLASDPDEDVKGAAERAMRLIDPTNGKP